MGSHLMFVFLLQMGSRLVFVFLDWGAGVMKNHVRKSCGEQQQEEEGR
jgi:hypothetical protein